jgi:hypothetical protein
MTAHHAGTVLSQFQVVMMLSVNNVCSFVKERAHKIIRMPPFIKEEKDTSIL